MSTVDLSGMLDKPRLRRTKAEVEKLKDLLNEFAQEEAPTTIRHLFYRMVAAGAIEKTEAQYQNVVIRLCTDMRMNGELPFRWIADNTRFVYQPESFDSVGEALNDAAKLYRKNLWRSLGDYVEIWCEKDAIRSILSEVTWQYDVPLMICRGQPSISFLYSTFENLLAQLQAGKRCHIYILTDYDRSGGLIDENIRKKLRFFWRKKFHYEMPDNARSIQPPEDDFDRAISFKRLAVTEDQIGELDLPTRPPKLHEKNGYTENVELDAMPTGYLRDLVRDAIEEYLPKEDFDMLKKVEGEEKAAFLKIAKRFKSN